MERHKSIGPMLTLARKPCFATFAGVGGVGATPPLRFQTKRRRASRKRPADQGCARLMSRESNLTRL